MNLTKISIVTVTFNCAKTIRRTIESVLAQNYGAIEYIVIDGGSTDGTVDILEEYSDKFTFWSSEKDNGIYDAMNKGIGKCTGELIAFLNSDDWYVEDVFKEVDSCYKTCNADIIYGDYIRVEKNGDRNLIVLNSINLGEMYFKWMFCHQAMFFRRQLFEDIGEYDLSYKVSADYELILRAYVQGAKFQYISKTICYFSLGGFCGTHMKECARDVKRLCIKHLPRQYEKDYLPKINQQYERVMRMVGLEEIEDKLIAGNPFLIKRLQGSLLLEYSNVYIFGAGRIGKKFIKIFLNLGKNIVGVMDNNPSLWGQKIEGIDIIRPHNGKKDAIVIIAIKDKKEMLVEQLEELGYQHKDIVDYEEIEKIIICDLGDYM